MINSMRSDQIRWVLNFFAATCLKARLGPLAFAALVRRSVPVGCGLVALAT
jgi:hypothetical protein